MRTASSRGRFLSALALAIGALLLPAPSGAQTPVTPYGRFLIPAPPSTQVAEYFGLGTQPGGPRAPISFNQEIRGLNKDTNTFDPIGVVRFDFDLFRARRGDGQSWFGAALVGGFYMRDGASVKTGFNLAWVQRVSATFNLTNNWNLPPRGSTPFPDATITSPAYPGNALPITPTNPPGPPTPGTALQDLPLRNINDGPQTWLAELALVGIAKNPDDDGCRQVRIIGSLRWGFQITTNPTVVTPLGPAWLDNSITANFLLDMNNYYSGNPVGGGAPIPGGGTRPPVTASRFCFGLDSNVFNNVPTPGAAGMLAMGGVVALRRRRGRP